MLEQKFSKKGRFRFQETWVFPNEVTEFIKSICASLQIEEKSICHVFCGKSQIGGLRIDSDESLNNYQRNLENFNEEIKQYKKPDLIANCLDLPELLGENSQENILADFPWMISYPNRRKFSYALRDICKPNGFLILNCPWNPWVKGLKIKQIWKVYQAFNSYRDLVDFWILQKEASEIG